MWASKSLLAAPETLRPEAVRLVRIDTVTGKVTRLLAGAYGMDSASGEEVLAW
jgi:hypothetical protein